MGRRACRSTKVKATISQTDNGQTPNALIEYPAALHVTSADPLPSSHMSTRAMIASSIDSKIQNPDASSAQKTEEKLKGPPRSPAAPQPRSPAAPQWRSGPSKVAFN